MNKKITCKKCGHSWTYKGKNKKTTSCPDCRRLVRLPPLLAAIILIGLFPMAYGDDLVNHSPFEKMYEEKGSTVQFWFNSTDVRVIFWYDYNFPLELIEAMPGRADSPSDYEHLKAIEIFIEEEKENIFKIIVKESLASSTDDKRETTVVERPPLLHETAAIAEELCFGGTEVEQQIHFENETLNISREFEGDIRNKIDAYRDAKNSEFCIAYQKARSLGFDFAKIQNPNPESNVDLDFTEYFKAQKTASLEDKQSATTIAEDYMCSEEGKRRGLCRALEDKGFSYGAGEHKFPEIRAKCFPLPSNPIELMCPLQSVTTYLAENVVAEEVAIAASRNAALVVACADAWDRVDSGKRGIGAWEPLLLDDTCVVHLPGMFAIRHALEFEATQ